jgi:hypothetical protein
MADERPPARQASRRWTRIEDYMVVFGRRRSSRPPLAPRTEPEEPRFTLSTLPYFVLIIALFAIAAAIMVLAWPGNQPQPRPVTATREQGVAPRGWFDKASKEFHRQSDADRK